ncbi:MAG: cytochrome P450 [Acidimicrobiales bacterium]
MLGILDSDADMFRGWVHDILESQDMARNAASTREALAYFRDRLAERREQPGDDIISLLAHSELDGEPLLDRTIAGSALILLLAGIDTVWNTLGSALWHLAGHPDDLRRLRAEPELMDAAVEEFLRFYAPVGLFRCVTRDSELAGKTLRAGEHVMLSFPAANRDPDVFPDADTFVIDRAHSRHVAFGVGIHRCIGSNIARMEMQVALEAWIRRIPTFRLDPSRPVEMTEGGAIRGPRCVPLLVG